MGSVVTWQATKLSAVTEQPEGGFESAQREVGGGGGAVVGGT